MTDPVLPPLPDRKPAVILVMEEAAPPGEKPEPPADPAPLQEHEVITLRCLCFRVQVLRSALVCALGRWAVSFSVHCFIRLFPATFTCCPV